MGNLLTPNLGLPDVNQEALLSRVAALEGRLARLFPYVEPPGWSALVDTDVNALKAGVRRADTFRVRGEVATDWQPRDARSKQKLGTEGREWAEAYIDEVFLNRLRADRGTALVAGDFTLSSGFGSTASIGTITGTDQRFRATITSAGTGQAANPTVILTFQDGTWSTAPFFVTSRAGGALTQSIFEVTTIASTGFAHKAHVPVVVVDRLFVKTPFIFI